LVIELLIVVVIVFLSVCFLTLLERKILGYVQNRKGPTKVLFLGVLQPVLDGGKLILKSLFIEKIYYFFIPFFSIVVISLLRLRFWFSSVRVILNNRVFFYSNIKICGCIYFIYIRVKKRKCLWGFRWFT